MNRATAVFEVERSPLGRKVPMLAVSLTFLWVAVSCVHADVTAETFMVEMRDGIRLATDVYFPDTSLPRPALLYRTPYWKFVDRPSPTYWNGKGYVLVVQDVRGRFGSEGVDSVFLDDGWGVKQDGYDTIEWIVQQTWCNGNVGMFGSSARGITTNRAAGSLHSNLICCVPIVACSDFYHQVVFPGGEFRKSICENWLRAQGSEYMIDYFLGLPYYSEEWEYMDLHTRTDSITAPMLHVGGWYDCFSDGIVEEFRDLQGKPQAGPQKLVMGPWTHGTVGTDDPVGELQYPDAAFDVSDYMARWLDYWVQADTNGVLDEPDVHYYLMGDPEKTDEIGCEWVEENVWPPENAVETSYFLAGSSRLSLTVPPDIDSQSFAYDPHYPVPTLGGNNLTIERGPYDQTAIGIRNDVLPFTTEVLNGPLRVEGIVRGELFVSSNREDTDFTLKLVDVYPDGREMLVTDGIARARYRLGDREEDITFLTPGEIVPITVSLPPTAIVFNSGHQVKVCVSSSNYPRYEINPNTDDPPYQETDTLIADNTLYYGGTYCSSVILPVVEGSIFVEYLQKTKTRPFALKSYPNPFSSHAVISYQLPQDSHVNLFIHDALGRRIRTLVDRRQPDGAHYEVWDGKNDSEIPVASGIYFCRLELDESTSQTQKMLLLR